MFSKKNILILFSAIIFISCSENSPLEEPETVGEKSITQEVYELINKHRASIGKDALILDDQVAKISLDHTKYMISVNKINHDDLKNRFATMRKLVKAISIAENVASHQKSAIQVVKSWLNSSGHKKNIEGNYTHTGIGIKKNAKGNYFFTQIFYSK